MLLFLILKSGCGVGFELGDLDYNWFENLRRIGFITKIIA